MNRILSILVVVSMVLSGLIVGQLLFSIPAIAPGTDLHDLTILPQNISISSGTPKSGETVTINATIWNIGNADATDVEVNFYEEDTLIGSENVDIPVNETWMNYTIDTNGDVGSYSSIALDSLNGIHISYVDSTNNALKYAYKPSGGSWAISAVDSGFVVESSSITVDSGDGVHISYHDDSAQELKYAYKSSGGNWSFQTVDSPPGDPGRYSSIAVDSLNEVHISYVDTNNNSLKYAYKPSGGSWTNNYIETGPSVIYTSIAIDGANGVHISYHDDSAKDLKYQYKPSGGNWATYTVDSTGEVGTYSSITVDDVNGVHISYCDFLNGDLKYAYKPNGGSWTSETIDTIGYIGESSSIALDDTGGIHISYNDCGNFDLKYAYKPNGGSWTNHTVDFPGNVGKDTSIAIDSTGGIHISNWDTGNIDLKYANLLAPPGNIRTSISWMPTIAGLRNITVKVDEDNIIEELNEKNNNTTVSITVTPGPLASIEIIPSSATLELNDTLQFTASGYDGYGNEVSISPTWNVSGIGGTIDQNGLFTARYPITSMVYADQSDIRDIATVTVQVNVTSDIDADGMLDWWEIEYDLDPFDGTDAGLDPDLDSLTNIQEFLNFSNPNNNETDGDSLGDGFEVIFSKTNASNWDTNGNGIGDGLEFIQNQGYLGWIGSLPNDWIGMTISWENYTIYVKTNSSVLEGEFDKDEQKLKIKVSGPEGTQGVTEIDVPKTLCEPEDIEIQLDGELINYSLTQDDDYYYIHIEYNHSIHELSAIFGQPSEIPRQHPDDEEGLLEDWSFIGMIIALIIIVILLIIITGNRSGKEDIGVQELPPEQLSKLLEKQHSEGKITDDTFNDAKSLLEKYGGD